MVHACVHSFTLSCAFWTYVKLQFPWGNGRYGIAIYVTWMQTQSASEGIVVGAYGRCVVNGEHVVDQPVVLRGNFISLVTRHGFSFVRFGIRDLAA